MDDILELLGHLGESYSPEVSIAVVEMVQKETHHRENIKASNRLEDVLTQISRNVM